LPLPLPLPCPGPFDAAIATGGAVVVVVVVAIVVVVVVGVVVVVVVAVATAAGVSATVKTSASGDVLSPPVLGVDRAVRAGPTRAPPPRASDVPAPGVPPPEPGRPPPGGNWELGVCDGVGGGVVLASGTVTGPLPMTRAATMDTVAATALSDAIVPSRHRWSRRVVATVMAAATSAGAGATDGYVGADRPNSGDAKTSSRVA
jgi:hypothetical protein